MGIQSSALPSTSLGHQQTGATSKSDMIWHASSVQNVCCIMSIYIYIMYVYVYALIYIYRERESSVLYSQNIRVTKTAYLCHKSLDNFAPLTILIPSPEKLTSTEKPNRSQQNLRSAIPNRHHLGHPCVALRVVRKWILYDLDSSCICIHMRFQSQIYQNLSHPVQLQ